MSIDAMKQALEALELMYACYAHQDWISHKQQEEKILAQCVATSMTLRQAIAEAEKQKPVEWGVDWGPDGNSVSIIKRLADGGLEVVGWEYAPHQLQRQPLTVEKLREHWQVAKVLDMTDAEIDFADYVLIARDVEALHGIKGEA